MKTLEKLYCENTYDTDKFNLGYIDGIYDPLFNNLSSSITMLEIGVQTGGSILLWKDFFDKNSKIYTLDIKSCAAIDGIDNVIQIVEDAYSNIAVSKFLDNTLDIVIDDGPHTYESFEYLISNYFNKLKQGGVMVIEDIIHTDWTPSLIQQAKDIGYSKTEVFNMGGKQKTKELLQLWTKGLDVVVLTK